MRIPSRQRKQPSNMEVALRLAKSLMPSDGDVDTFIGAIAAFRGKPIRVLDMPIPPTSPSGGWFACENDDYLVVDVASTQSRRAAIICHELAHILLGHQGDVLGSDQLSILAPSMDPVVAARFLGRHGYATQIEQEAELLGTQLVSVAQQAHFNAINNDRVSSRLR